MKKLFIVLMSILMVSLCGCEEKELAAPEKDVKYNQGDIQDIIDSTEFFPKESADSESSTIIVEPIITPSENEIPVDYNTSIDTSEGDLLYEINHVLTDDELAKLVDFDSKRIRAEATTAVRYSSEILNVTIEIYDDVISEKFLSYNDEQYLTFQIYLDNDYSYLFSDTLDKKIKYRSSAASQFVDTEEVDNINSYFSDIDVGVYYQGIQNMNHVFKSDDGTLYLTPVDGDHYLTIWYPESDGYVTTVKYEQVNDPISIPNVDWEDVDESTMAQSILTYLMYFAYGNMEE